MFELVRFCRLAVLFWALVSAASSTRLSAADADVSLAQRYAAADANGDKKLTLDEFLKLPGEQPVLQRDFRLFDFDGNQTLSPDSLHLSPGEKADLIVFLKSLDERIPFEAPPTSLPRSSRSELNRRAIGGEY